MALAQTNWPVSCSGVSTIVWKGLHSDCGKVKVKPSPRIHSDSSLDGRHASGQSRCQRIEHDTRNKQRDLHCTSWSVTNLLSCIRCNLVFFEDRCGNVIMPRGPPVRPPASLALDKTLNFAFNTVVDMTHYSVKLFYIDTLAPSLRSNHRYSEASCNLTKPGPRG